MKTWLNNPVYFRYAFIVIFVIIFYNQKKKRFIRQILIVDLSIGKYSINFLDMEER
jgi:hypothetical protein